jgi:hypothetical protein
MVAIYMFIGIHTYMQVLQLFEKNLTKPSLNICHIVELTLNLGMMGWHYCLHGAYSLCLARISFNYYRML